MILHTLNQHSELLVRNCLNTIASGDSLLLIENAVYLGIEESFSTSPMAMRTDINLYALIPDCEARGISPLLFPGFDLIDYPGFVKLCTEHKQVISWY
ncbi:sulfurtransferase complex subunit TusB [Endozoicomonas sp. SM1973]|uniref:Sulfurtransferase complex subunit TusB n=1 Tax=Spartinivicinus marinus TaxID=2994442 RepID=A0A853HYH1_9GAMM|nr:sulfurtransferase complex subunit TusB [Spartinivicinus marinus]MCX4029007.1 sulfurtransferase complex subunit TusB [Spartinivicinus marinus]NYZ65409.1 sulfurtransferase complex subunit TusB [Spartinivicinus marinus]